MAPSATDAQRTPTVEDVRARLHSTNPPDVAWAAFDAATFQMREVAPDLIAVLDTPPELEERIRDPLISAVLDALVQLRGTGRFPPAFLPRHPRSWTDITRGGLFKP